MTHRQATARGRADQHGSASGQLSLPLEHVPPPLRKAGLATAHVRPLVSRGRDPGGVIQSFRTDPARAWRYALVEHRGGGHHAGVLLDCDAPYDHVLAAIDDHRIPRPSVAIVRRSNGHSALAWFTDPPIHRYPEARLAPLKLLARVSEYIATVVGADPGYSGVLFRNATAVDRARFLTELGHGFTLAELADWIPKGWRVPNAKRTGVGRNCDLFARLMRFAGSAAGRSADLVAAGHGINANFGEPLPDREVTDTARSVDRYRAGWEARGWHRPDWIERQRARGARGGRKSGAARRVKREPLRQAALHLLAGGLAVQDVAATVGVSRSTIFRWKRGCHEANTDIPAPAPLRLWKEGGN